MRLLLTVVVALAAPTHAQRAALVASLRHAQGDVAVQTISVSKADSSYATIRWGFKTATSDSLFHHAGGRWKVIWSRESERPADGACAFSPAKVVRELYGVKCPSEAALHARTATAAEQAALEASFRSSKLTPYWRDTHQLANPVHLACRLDVGGGNGDVPLGCEGRDLVQAWEQVDGRARNAVRRRDAAAASDRVVARVVRGLQRCRVRRELVVVRARLIAIAAVVVRRCGRRGVARAGFPSLFVTYKTENCTFTFRNDAGKTVHTILPGDYQVVVATSGTLRRLLRLRRNRPEGLQGLRRVPADGSRRQPHDHAGLRRFVGRDPRRDVQGGRHLHRSGRPQRRRHEEVIHRCDVGLGGRGAPGRAPSNRELEGRAGADPQRQGGLLAQAGEVDDSRSATTRRRAGSRSSNSPRARSR